MFRSFRCFVGSLKPFSCKPYYNLALIYFTLARKRKVVFILPFGYAKYFLKFICVGLYRVRLAPLFDYADGFFGVLRLGAINS